MAKVVIKQRKCNLTAKDYKIAKGEEAYGIQRIQKNEGLRTVWLSVQKDTKTSNVHDSVFHVVAREEDDKIVEVEVLDCKETTVLGTSTVDGDDMIHGFGTTEKDPFGLKKRFTNFMDNMTESGPYLTEPKSVKKYTKTLAD